MIPRLDLTGFGSTHSAEWPESPERVHSPFQPRQPLRKLRLLVDADVLADDGSDPFSRTRLLQGLLNHPLLQVCRYSDDGPGSDADWLQPRFGPEIARGWVTPRGDDQGFDYSFGDDAWSAWYDSTSARGWAGVPTSAYTDLSLGEAEVRRQRDGVAMAIAQEIVPDVFVTNRPHLLAISPDRRSLTLCDLSESLAVVGLYLRCQNDYRIWLDPGSPPSFTLGKGFFFLVATSGLLPEAGHWSNACRRKSSSTGDDSIQNLTHSLFERVTRVLKNRDAVNWALNQRLDDGARREDIVDAFETAMLMLMGAVDVTAKVAHRLLGLPPDQERGAAWQSTSWLDKIRSQAPSLADVVPIGGNAANALAVLRLVRNSIHGEAIQGSEVQDVRGRRVRMHIPRSDKGKLIAAVSALGGLESWGLEEVNPANSPSALYGDPSVLLDQLLPRVFELLNAVMRETVEALSSKGPGSSGSRAPIRRAGGTTDWFSAPRTAVVRALLGL